MEPNGLYALHGVWFARELGRHSPSSFSSAQNAEHGFRLLLGGSFWPWEPLFGSMDCHTRQYHRSRTGLRRWARPMTTWTGKFIPATITTRYTAFVLCLTEETPSTLKLKSSFQIGTLPQFSTDNLFALCISTMIKGSSRTKRLTLKFYRERMRVFMTLTMRGQLGSGWQFQLALRWESLDSPVLNT
jgi:hypothetical protein